MRKLDTLFAVAMLTTAAGAQVHPLPSSGVEYIFPGFSFHSPGRSWYSQDTFPNQTRDRSVKGRFIVNIGAHNGPKTMVGAIFGAGKPETALIEVAAMTMPVEGRNPTASLKMLAEKLAAKELEDSKRFHQISLQIEPTTLDGAQCFRREQVIEDRGVPGHQKELFTLSIHGLVCSHPDFPAFIVRSDFSTRLLAGNASFVDEPAALVSRNSLKFTPIGYRVSYIPTGPLPQFMAESDGAIWVAYGADNGKLARINPLTNKVAAVIPAGKVPVGVTADASGVWVTNAESNTVQRIDPKTNTVIGTFDVPKQPGGIVAGAGAIWVACDEGGAVARIDPATGKVTTITGVGKRPAGVAFANGTVFVTDIAASIVTRIDPATNQAAGTINSGKFANTLLPVGHYLWVASKDDPPAVLRLDPAAPTAPPLRYSDGIDYVPTGMAMHDGKLWVANWAGTTVSLLDPESGSARYVLAGPGPMAILSAQGSLWVSLAGLDGVLRFDPKQ